MLDLAAALFAYQLIHSRGLEINVYTMHGTEKSVRDPREYV